MFILSSSLTFASCVLCIAIIPSHNLTCICQCLGKLAFANPERLVPELNSRLSSTSPKARSTFVSALKFAIHEQAAPVDAAIAPVMTNFLALLSDKELNVRRAALLTLNWAAHNKPALVRGILPQHLPALYAEAKVKPELIKEVDLGPFKHKVCCRDCFVHL